jgi:hypothetical protein
MLPISVPLQEALPVLIMALNGSVKIYLDKNE